MLLTEYIPGGSLSQLLNDPDSYAKLTLKHCARLARQIADGVRALHYNSPCIVHRDIKSLNVLLTEYGDAKLCDFGFARTATTPSRLA